MATASNAQQEASASLRRLRWTSAEFHRLIDAGFIREGSGAFLWDGEIIEPMARKRPHINAEKYLERILNTLYPDDAWTVDQDSTLFLRDGCEPQPDLMVLRGPRSRYHDRVPTPADVELLVEVAHSTYPFDAGEGLAAYARAGIAPYWIVNLAARRIEVYTDPDPGQGAYRSREDYGPGTTVPLGGHGVAVDDVVRQGG